MAVYIAAADARDAHELARVAARTFPLACPPSSTPQDIAAFIDAHLSAVRFTDYLADPRRVVLTARDDGRIVAYCILIHGVPDDTDVYKVVTAYPTVELSKMYALPASHGTGASQSLMNAALSHAKDAAAQSMWLGVNQHNARAQRFYAQHGFVIKGTKTFQLGARVELDYVMLRDIT